MPLSPHELSALTVSLQVAGLALALTLVPGVFLGWLLARRRFPGKSLIEGLVFLPLVVPPVVTGYFLLKVLGRQGWIGGWVQETFGISLTFNLFAMAVAGGLVGLPLLVRSVRVAMENVDPGLEQAARTLGLGPWATLARITLPLARSGIIAGSLLAFARALGEFGATVMVAPNLPGTRTLALEVYRQASVPGGETAILRLALLSIGISWIALVLSERLAGRPGRRS